MGKQINFYMSENIEDKFIDMLCEKNFVFLFENMENKSIDMLFTKESIISIADKFYNCYLYKKEYGNFFQRSDTEYLVDSYCSPIIEFKRTIKMSDEKLIIRGRLWVTSGVLKDNTADKNALMKDYNMLARWIKKNVPHQTIAVDDFVIKEHINNEINELVKQGFKTNA